MKQSGFANILLIITAIILISAGGYYAWSKKSPAKSEKVATHDAKDLKAYENKEGVQPNISLLSPNGEETWGLGSAKRISWSSNIDSFWNILPKAYKVGEHKITYMIYLRPVNQQITYVVGSSENPYLDWKVGSVEKCYIDYSCEDIVVPPGKYYIDVVFVDAFRTFETEIANRRGLPIIISAPSVSSQIDTSDWKTYRNEEYGFEIKYPKEG